MKTIEVVAGIIEFENEILCMQRGEGNNKETSMKWEFPGGKIDDGETPEEALTREIQEELELEIFNLKLFDTINYTFLDFEMIMHVFKCKTNTKNFVMNVHLDHKWLNTENLQDLDWAPSDKIVVDKLSKNK